VVRTIDIEDLQRWNDGDISGGSLPSTQPDFSAVLRADRKRGRQIRLRARRSGCDAPVFYFQ